MTMPTCCYENCTRAATDFDVDGDNACPLHAAREDREYVIVTDLESAEWCDAPLAEKVAAALAEKGWTVTIRAPSRFVTGEALGTYERTSQGLQILGYSIPQPQALRDAVEDAWNASV